jgi:hypothetical protein
LNSISKYYVAGTDVNAKDYVAGTEVNVKYFSSLLQQLSCNLFKEHFEGFYEEVLKTHRQYATLFKNPKDFEKEINDYKAKFVEYRKPLINTITNGFITVQKDTLRQLVYIT